MHFPPNSQPANAPFCPLSHVACVFLLDGTPLSKDPDDWWVGAGKAIRQAVEKSGVPPEEIVSMGLDTTCCSVVALDSHVSPLPPPPGSPNRLAAKPVVTLSRRKLNGVWYSSGRVGIGRRCRSSQHFYAGKTKLINLTKV